MALTYNISSDSQSAPERSSFTSAPASDARVSELGILLPEFSPEDIPAALNSIAATFPDERIVAAVPMAPIDVKQWPSIEIVQVPNARPDMGWVLTTADYASASHLASDHKLRAVVILGNADAVVDPSLLRQLSNGIRNSNVDLVLPRYIVGPADALVNSALLYPLSRALFGADIRFPLPTIAALSVRMTQRLLTSTQRLLSASQGSSFLWPVAEAAIAGYSVREVAADISLPHIPLTEDFNALFTNVAGSLFTDIDVKASFWQRARNLPLRPSTAAISPSSPLLDSLTEIQPMIESFHLAYNNLQEIWSLVLPPQSRLALKKLSQLSTDTFVMEPDLWARIVYDFVLAFHLRTLNRSHLIGTMIPLYRAWAASYLRLVANDPDRAAHAIQMNATAFEAEKSYIVSRWRWPDRFNP